MLKKCLKLAPFGSVPYYFTAMKYTSYGIGAATGAAGFTKASVRYPRIYIEANDFFFSTFPGVPAQSWGGLGGVATVKAYEAYQALKDFLDDCKDD